MIWDHLDCLFFLKESSCGDEPSEQAGNLEEKLTLKRKIFQQNTILFLPLESWVRYEGKSFQWCHFSSVIHSVNHPLLTSHKHSNCATVGGCCLFVITPAAVHLVTSHLKSRMSRCCHSMKGRCKCFRGSEGG